MLPDFQGLRQPPCDRTNSDPLKPRSNTPSSQSRSFNKFSELQTNSAQPTPKKRTANAFTYVPEALDNFLALWPHRFDFLYAPHPLPGQKPDWKTESRYPLSDRLIDQGAFLYGVRPGPTATYAMLDIDSGSPYHPRRDPLAFQRICDTLETLGLVEHLTVTSSDSGGLHLYFPCAEPLPSWQLAIGITTLLENDGFKIMAGWLEVFPNPKPFATDGTLSLFNGHRLPLQQGSYLLNDDLAPTASTQGTFVRYWQQAAKRNDICLPLLEQTIRQSRRQTYRVTGKAEKFINDLNAEIEPGWSGPGQTNHLIGRIAMRSYIFGHVLYATAPLKGKALVDDIVRVAKSLPGFADYCGHQLEIEQKAQSWAKKIERERRYYPYDTSKLKKAKDGPSWNQVQQQGARDRIQAAVLDLLRQEQWPSAVGKRFNLLCATGISGSTLYNHQDLWHPRFCSLELPQITPVENPPDPPVLHEGGVIACAGGAAITPSCASLLGPTGCNKPDSKAFSPAEAGVNDDDSDTGCNDELGQSHQPDSAAQNTAPPVRTSPPRQLILDIQSALLATQAAQRAKVQASRQAQQLSGRKQAMAAHVARLHEWVDSGDPILMAEARRQLGRIENSS
jgi:hypothetical protein